MPNNLTFCIIMPCYNSEAYVSNAIKSIQNSTYSLWKLIAVNDGSTDNTLAILNTFAEKDNRIQVYSKENGGYCSAVNYGLDKICGDYFLLMGSDDQLSKDLFSDLAENTADEFPDMIGFRTVRVIDGKIAGIDPDTNFSSKVFADNTTIKEFETFFPKHAQIFFIRDTSKCYKTSLLGELRYFGKYGFDADGIFTMLFSHRSRSFSCIPINGYYWTLRADSLSAKPTVAMDYDRLDNWATFFTIIQYYSSDEITLHEIKYLNTPKSIGVSLLKRSGYFDLETNNRICKAIKPILDAEKKIGIKSNNSLKWKFYLRYPKVGSTIYRFISTQKH